MMKAATIEFLARFRHYVEAEPGTRHLSVEAHPRAAPPFSYPRSAHAGTVVLDAQCDPAPSSALEMRNGWPDHLEGVFSSRLPTISSKSRSPPDRQVGWHLQVHPSLSGRGGRRRGRCTPPGHSETLRDLGAPLARRVIVDGAGSAERCSPMAASILGGQLGHLIALC